MLENKSIRRPFELELGLPVKTYDIDFAGIVSNIVYIRWLEDLRLAILTSYFPLEQQLEADIFPVLIKTNVEYKKPIRIIDKPIGKMWMTEMSSFKWVVAAEISVDNKIATYAEQTGIFINSSTWSPIPIPENLAKQYLKFQRMFEKLGEVKL